MVFTDQSRDEPRRRRADLAQIQGIGSMTSIGRSAGAVLMVLLLVAGSAARVYARWTRPTADADASLASDRYEAALAGYREAEARFDRFAAARQLFAADYGHVMETQLWTLYRLQRYDETIDKAQ